MGRDPECHRRVPVRRPVTGEDAIDAVPRSTRSKEEDFVREIVACYFNQICLCSLLHSGVVRFPVSSDMPPTEFYIDEQEIKVKSSSPQR
jgi:hypothetical protein